MLTGRWQELLGDGAEQIRAVLFDAVGTLIFPEGSIAEIYAEVGQRHGSSRTAEAISKRFGAALRASQLPDLRSSEAIERARWKGIVKTLLDDLPDTSAVYEELWDRFAQPATWRLAPRAETLLASLLSTGLQVGVASNFDSRLHRVLAGRLPDEARVFVSSEVGWQKPATEFFRAAEEKLALVPEQIVLVGDDWTNDVLGARKAGWRAIGVAPSNEEQMSIARIGDLA